jgi:hypothetical protein
VVDISVTADNENRTIILTYRDTLSIQETYKFSHIHNQTVSSSTWNVTHNLNKYPSVSVVDSSNEEVIGEVQHTNSNSLTVKFSAPFSGKAFLN